MDKLVAAHGNFDTASVVTGEGRGKAVPADRVREAVLGEGGGGWRELREEFGGLVKPDIVFFGEDLPARFFRLAAQDMKDCDLLLVMGTSLAVHPFAGIMHLVRGDVPRLLLNREKVGDCNPDLAQAYLEAGEVPKGFIFDEKLRTRDVFHEGDCDDSVRQLCRLLGWEEELDKLIAADSAEDAQVGRDGGGDTGAGVAEKKNPSGATDCSEPNEKDERGI